MKKIDMAISIDEALANCLETLIKQGSSIEDCVARYPQFENELVELVGMVYSLNSLDHISTRTQFAENASRRLVSKLPDRNVSYRQKIRPIKRKRKLKLIRGFSVVQIVIVVVLILSAVTGGTAFAADYAEPGDLLYGLDLQLEQIQLELAPNEEAATRIHLKIADERLEEAQNKLNDGDVDNGNAALDAYGLEVAALAKLVGSEGGVDQENLIELVNTALSRHQEVLTQLLDKVPDQARAGIQRALDASDKSKEDIPKGPPDDVPKGKPEDKPMGNSKGNPKDKSKGKPDFVKNPPGKP
jgi:hypothetical protein